jgi:(p)ppGpp synthase/HD superfamily hydrolase
MREKIKHPETNWNNLCNCKSCRKKNKQMMKNYEREKRLLLAVNDLLQACKQMVKQWHEEMRTKGVSVPNKGIALATKAIMKAEGAK